MPSPFVTSSGESEPRFELRITPGTLTDVEESGPITELPQAFDLKQNFPNPFNPSTNIQFELPERADVQLTVYDLMGREIAMLLNEARAAGRHSVTFDASRLSSGVYIYRLQAGERVFTRKMVLIK